MPRETSRDAVAGSRRRGSTRSEVSALGLAWPPQIFSLSHLAVPFRPDDPLFGINPDMSVSYGLRLGLLAPRGERGVLSVSARPVHALELQSVLPLRRAEDPGVREIIPPSGEVFPSWLDNGRVSARPLRPSVCGCCSASPAAAQTTTGTILGTVRDTAGGPMPGVGVQISSASLQGVRTATTEGDGRFRFPALPPGVYTVKASLAGFHDAEKEATVTLDATVTADFTLEPELQESVAVTGSAPLVDTTSTTTGTSYTSRVITHLPVARNYADIVRSNPGVLPDTGETQGRSLALSIYGSTSVEHQWIIDGVNTTNVLKGMQGKAINNEFVQEVEVKTGGYQAEYGRAIGGVINVITKSGGNQFHGDGFVYYDSSALQAEREFEPGVDSDLSGMRVADYTRTDFGADLGGYVMQGPALVLRGVQPGELPAQISRYVSSDLVPDHGAVPGREHGQPLLGQADLEHRREHDPGWQRLRRPDDELRGEPRRSAPGRASRYRIRHPGTWESTRTIGGTDFGLRVTQLLGSSGLLTLQAARHQDKYELVPSGAGLQVRVEDWTCPEGVGTPDAPCDVPGEANFVDGGLGFIYGPVNNSKSHRDQIRADSTFFRGNHELKLGGDYQDGHTEALNFFSGGQRARRYDDYGQVYYQHSFYATSPTDLTPVPEANTAITRDVGAYVQDSWKPAPNLTINAGLRFDREWIINFADEAVITTNEWQPRLGVVWDPFGDGSSKVYAFAGRFSWGMPTDLAMRVYGAQFFERHYNFVQDSVVPDPNVIGHEDFAFQGNAFGEPSDPGIKGIAQDELTLGVEKTLSGGTLTLGLKGTYRSLANAIEDRCDLDYNAADNDYSTCGLMNPGSDGRFAHGDFHYCTGLDDFNNCATANSVVRRVCDTRRQAHLSRNRATGKQDLLPESLASGFLRLFVAARQLRRRGQRGHGPDRSRHQRGLRLRAVPAQFLRAALPRSATPAAPGRLLRHAVRPFGRSPDVGTLGGAAQPVRLLQWLLRRIIQIVPKGYAGRLPTEWDGNLTLAYPIRIGPVTATLQGYVFNLFNNQIRTAPGYDLERSAAERISRHDLRSESAVEQRELRPDHRAFGPAPLPRRDPDLVLGAPGVGSGGAACASPV